MSQSQKFNFAPRLSDPYSLRPWWVIRAGYGLFYGVEEIGGSPLIIENSPIEYHVTRTSSSPVLLITSTNSLGPLENTFANLSLAPSTVNVAGVSLVGWQYHWQTPYTQSQNFMMEFQLAKSTTLTTGYAGSEASHIETVLNANYPRVLLPTTVNQATYVPYTHTALSGNNLTLTTANSHYESWQTTFHRRFSHGLDLLADFTWSKRLTDARGPLENAIGSYRAPFLPGFGIQRDYALADFKVPRALQVRGVYQLPLGPRQAFASRAHGFTRFVVAGWSLNWVMTIQDGQPFTVRCARSTSNGFGCNALLVPGANPYRNSSVAHFVNAAAFTSPPTVAIGQTDYTPLGRSATQVLEAPFHRLDFSVFKKFPITERMNAELRSEFFNLTNTPNFANSSNLNYTNLTNFGQITGTRHSPSDPREIQFAVKLYW